MSPTHDSEMQNLDTRLLSNFIYEFNIARRHVTAYPDNHPIINTTLSKVTTMLKQLLESREDITLGIAKDALLIGDSYLDKNNPVYRDLARLFFGHGLAAVTFSKRLGVAELLGFFKIITQKREDIDKTGGFLSSIAKSDIQGIQVTPINYSAFLATEEETIQGGEQILLEKQSALIWDNFVRNLLKGAIADDSSTSFNHSMLDPEIVSDIFNKRYELTSSQEQRKLSYEHSISEFLKNIDANERGVQNEELLLRLSAYINKLSPELRKQFLNSAFSTLANHRKLAAPVLSKVSQEAILDALKDLSDRNAKLPQTMLDLIGRLSRNLDGNSNPLSSQLHTIVDEELKEKMATIFKEEAPENFIPENYLKALKTIIAENTISVSEMDEIASLRDSLTGHNVEEQISHIILDMINNSPDAYNSDFMQKNLQELCGYFLSMGDFKELSNVYNKMSQKADNLQNPAPVGFISFFSSPAFLNEVLHGVVFWGKSKFDEISDLIDSVGAPFVEPMLDRLAEEQNMSMRRFYMDRLRFIGVPARDASIARLRDPRWYFLRNLILLLNNIGDPSVVTHIRRLTMHKHSKVRQEAIKTLLGFKDPEGDNILLRDMTSNDKETVINAVKMAESSTNAEVLNLLINNLGRSGLGGFEYELKSASIHSLGGIGDSRAIPALEKFLKSRTILRSSQLNTLKIEVVQSMKKYPMEAVQQLLQSLIKNGNTEISAAASESLRQINGGERVRQ